MVEDLHRRELVAADAAVDRAELDARGRRLGTEKAGRVKGCRGGAKEESASMHRTCFLSADRG